MGNNEKISGYTLPEMQKLIKKAGGLFYQYRPCRRNSSIIYDIENIRHGVVYAQAPLNMNDPFDSMIGYSSEDIYSECISMILESFQLEGNSKVLVAYLLKYRKFGKLAELVSAINELKRYFIGKQREMHQHNISLQQFVQYNTKVLRSKLPPKLKKIFADQAYLAFAGLIVQLSEVEITEGNIVELLQVDEALAELQEKAEEVQETVFIPEIKDFLAKTTISCFSASGWDNQLMWAHYANSYSGFCVEYDFSKVTDYIGLICPVKYMTSRPHLSLKDIGIAGFSTDAKDSTIHCDIDYQNLLSKLLAKNACWKYEEEWRIINFGETNTPKLIELPFISSITIGINIDPICRKMLVDVCKLKNIPVYQLSIGYETFKLYRDLIDVDSVSFNEAEELELISFLAKHFSDSSTVLVNACSIFTEASDKQKFEFHSLSDALEKAEDILTDVYILKNCINRFAKYSIEDASPASIPEDLRATVNGLDEMVSVFHNSTESLAAPIFFQVINGTVPPYVAKKLGIMIQNIHAVSQQVAAIPWPSFFTPITSDNLPEVEKQHETDS